MLRIAHITGMASLKYGGFERFMLALARECGRRGHRFHCVWESPSASSEFERDLASAGAICTVMPARGRAFAFLCQLVQWLIRQRIDVMHAHFQPAALLSLVAARLTRVAIPVCTLHSGVPDFLIARFPPKATLVARLRQALAARILTVSNAVREQYGRLGMGGRAKQIRYIGVPLTAAARTRAQVRRELGLQEDAQVIACIAFHARIKGVDVLLGALAQLRERFPRLRLIQIGGSIALEGSSATEQLYALSRELDVADRIIWTGRRDDVRDLLEAADLYCQPSRSEGIGLAVLEAMSAGLPVVASRVGGIPEAVVDGQTGLLVEPDSPVSMAAALARLLSSPETRRMMGANGRKRILDHFELERQTAQLVDWYEQMMNRRPA